MSALKHESQILLYYFGSENKSIAFTCDFCILFSIFPLSWDVSLTILTLYVTCRCKC